MAKNAVAKQYNPFLWSNGKYGSAPQLIYNTSFADPAENPLSESGVWGSSATVTPWGTAMRKSGGRCFGTMVTNDAENYPDSGALYTAAGRIRDSESIITFGNASAPDSMEVEQLFRMDYGPNYARGIEVDFGLYGGNALAIILWHRSLAQPGLDGFTFLLDTIWPSGAVWATGAQARSSVVGNTITVEYKASGGSTWDTLFSDDFDLPNNTGYSGVGAWNNTDDGGNSNKFYMSSYTLNRM